MNIFEKQLKIHVNINIFNCVCRFKIIFKFWDVWYDVEKSGHIFVRYFIFIITLVAFDVNAVTVSVLSERFLLLFVKHLEI